MLDKTKYPPTEEDFLNTLENLDRAVRKAQLIHKIELKSRESENASPGGLEQIKLDLQAYREQIRLLDIENQNPGG
jgi:hypothetical protein